MTFGIEGVFQIDGVNLRFKEKMYPTMIGLMNSGKELTL